MKKTKFFVNKLFMRFFLPALLSSLALSIGAIADTLFVGSKIGQEGLFIIGAASPIYAIISTVSLGLASGCAVHFSQALGEGKESDAKKIFFSTIFWDFIFIVILISFGLIFQKPLMRLLGANPSVQMYETYVRTMLICSPILFMQAPLQFAVYADGKPTLASIALICGAVVDVTSGYFLIVHMDLGPVASVYSTLIGAIVMESICLSHFFTKRGVLNFKGLSAPSIKVAFKSFFTGFSTAIIYFYQFVTVLIFNRVLLQISGDWAVAGYDVIYNVGAFVIAITEAIGMAIGTLISTFFAERNLKGCKDSLKLSIAIGFGLTAISVIILTIFAPQLCKVFGVTQEFVEATSFGLRNYLIALLFGSLNGIFAGYFQAVEKEKFSYLLSFLRSFVALLISGIFLSMIGYKAFTFAFMISEVITFVVALPILLKVKVIPDDGANVYAETFIGSPEHISLVTERIGDFLLEKGFDQKRSYLVSLSIDETLNLITANKDNAFLQLTLILNNEDVSLHIRDNAKAFNIFELSEDEELGLKIIKKSCQGFYYREFVGFNTLTIEF